MDMEDKLKAKCNMESEEYLEQENNVLKHTIANLNLMNYEILQMAKAHKDEETAKFVIQTLEGSH